MANISRPFQIALVAVVLLAGVWLFALQGHSQSSSQSGGSGSSASAAQQPAAKPTTAYHGSAPGVAGLTGDVAKAKGAVSTSQQNAHELESKSAAASSSGGTAATSGPAASTGASGPSSSSATSQAATGTSGAGASAPSKTSTAAIGTTGTHAPSAAKSPSVVHRTVVVKSHKSSPAAAVARQKQVEASIAAGNVVVLLFWNSRGADDAADAAAVHAVAKGSGKTAVMFAKAGEVAAFGSVTRGVQIFGTPTILVVGKSGKATVITGLTDVFSLKQAIGEARHA